MRITLFIALFIQFISFSVRGASFKRAEIVEVSYTCKKGVWVDTSYFPLYFHHKNFVTDVLGDIEKYTKEKFGIEDVGFRFPDSIKYQQLSWKPISTLKDYAKSKADPNTVYVSVNTLLREFAQIGNEIIYYFITDVNILNHKGRSVYKFRNKIPFVVYNNEYIGGKIELGEQDFYRFYLDGVYFAFNGEKKVEEKQIVFKPPTPYYASYVENSWMFFLELKGKEYRYGSKEDRLAKVLSFKEANLGKKPTKLYAQDQASYVWDRYMLINHLFNDSVFIAVEDEYIESTYESRTAKGIKIYLQSGGKRTGSFYFKKGKETHGVINDIEFRLIWKEKFVALEIYSQGKLLALVNYIDNLRSVFIVKDYTREQFGNVLIASFIYDYFLSLSR